MTCTIAKLRIGQRFSWIPAAWYGPCKLTSKTRRQDSDVELVNGVYRIKRFVLYDLVYDAAVVNPPGIDYGVPAETRVRLLKRLKEKK
jgi:hypothetical protein